ncbi:hypothetical protein E3N88_44549 [Mikania micrantha]|uniref:Uncharacterized protein n=1 Tax=Mikania micrantha TaxID=192012 RepID=A0A5N6LBN7_9ASTR|nr:hypothetical protein E3N88_44549 [Mikania micrantha]
MKLAEIEFETRRNRVPVEIKRKRQVFIIMTSSRYAMRKKFTFAVREGFRGFPAYFVFRGELSRSLRRHLGSIGGLEDLVYM